MKKLIMHVQAPHSACLHQVNQTRVIGRQGFDAAIQLLRRRRKGLQTEQNNGKVGRREADRAKHTAYKKCTLYGKEKQKLMSEHVLNYWLTCYCQKYFCKDSTKLHGLVSQKLAREKSERWTTSYTVSYSVIQWNLRKTDTYGTGGCVRFPLQGG